MHTQETTLHGVPTADSANNVRMRDVVGNKSDTNAGNSLIASQKVPTAGGAGNTFMRDVIGNRSETHTSTTIAGRLNALSDHAHSASNVYPTLAGGVPVGAGVGAWVISAATVQVVPISTIASDFDIHKVFVEAVGSADIYEIVLYYDIGGGDVECGRTRASGVGEWDISTPIIAANAIIRAATASTNGGTSATIALRYHIY